MDNLLELHAIVNKLLIIILLLPLLLQGDR